MDSGTDIEPHSKIDDINVRINFDENHNYNVVYENIITHIERGENVCEQSSSSLQTFAINYHR